MDDLVTQELNRASDRSRKQNENFAGVVLEKSFSGARSSSSSSRTTKRKISKMSWKSLIGSGDSSKQPSEAVKLAMTKLAAAQKSEEKDSEKAFHLLGEVFQNYFPPPGIIPLTSSSMELLEKFLLDWKEKLSIELVTNANETQKDKALDTAKAVGIVLECITRSSADTLTRKSASLVQLCEDAVGIAIHYLTILNSELRDYHDEEDLTKRCQILSDWFMYCVRYVSHSLLALSNLDCNDAVTALRVMKLFASLESPLGESMEALEHVEVALAVIRSNVAEGRYVPYPEMSRKTVALLEVSGLNNWERPFQGGVNIEDENLRSLILQKIGFLKREGLSSAGALVSEDEHLAKYLISEEKYINGVVEAISWYEAMDSENSADSITLETLNGVVEFCWYISETSPDRKSDSFQVAVKLLTKVANSLKKDGGKISFLMVINEFMQRGGVSALEILRESNLLKPLVQDCIDSSSCAEVQSETLALIRVVAEACGQDVLQEVRLFLSYVYKLDAVTTNVTNSISLLNVLSTMFVTASVRITWKKLSNPRQSLADPQLLIRQYAAFGGMKNSSLPMTYLQEEVMEELFEEDILVSLIEKAVELAETESESGSQLACAVTMTLSSLMSHPVGISSAILSESFTTSLSQLISFKDTLQLAVHHTVTLLITPILDSSISRMRSGLEVLDEDSISTDDMIELESTTRSKSHGVIMPESKPTLQSRKKDIFRSLLTAAVGARDPQDMRILLQGVRAVIGSGILSSDQKPESRIPVRDLSMHRILVNLLKRGNDVCDSPESLDEFITDILRTIAAFLRRDSFIAELIDWKEMRIVLNSLTRYYSLGNLTQILSVVLGDESPSLEDVYACVGKDRSLLLEAMQGQKIRDGKPLKLLVHLGLDCTDRNVQVTLFSVLYELFSINSPNKAVGGRVGLVELFLDEVEKWKSDSGLAELICRIIGSIAKFHMPPKTLYKIVRFVEEGPSSSYDPYVACNLLQFLGEALNSKDPIAELDLTGLNSGLLASNGLTSFPPTKGGYSISAWFRPSIVNTRNILFSVYEDSGNNFEVSFENDQLIMAYGAARSKDQIVGQSDSRATTSEVDVYLNGTCVARSSLRYPRFTKDSVHLAIGCSSFNSTGCMRGQLANFIVYGDVLRKELCESLFALGVNQVNSAFSHSDTLLENAVRHKVLPEVCMNLIDPRLSEKVLLLYTSTAADNKGCPDNSSLSASGSRQSGPARYIGDFENTRLYTPSSIREAFNSLGGFRLALRFFSMLDDIAGSSLESDTVAPALGFSIRLLSASVRDDLVSREYIKELRAVELSSCFAKEASDSHLTLGAAEAALDFLEAAKGDDELAASIAACWIADMELWSKAEESAQMGVLDCILKCFASASSNPQSTAVVEAVHVDDFVLGAIESKRSDLRRKLLRIALERALYFKPAEVEKRKMATRLIFGVGSRNETETNEDLALDLFVVATETKWGSPTAIASLIAECGADCVGIVLSNFRVESEKLRFTAMRLACTVCKRPDGAEFVAKVLSTMGDCFIARGIEMSAHQFLLDTAFGEDHGNVKSSAFPTTIPLMFLLIANDPDLASRATALRAVVNEIEAKEENRNYMLSFPLWPTWIAKILEFTIKDETDAYAVQGAAEQIVSVLSLHAFRKRPLEDFFVLLQGFLASGSERFTNLALQTTIAMIDKELVPIVLKGQRLAVDYKKEAFLERICATMMCVEMIATSLCEELSEQDALLVFRAVQSTKLLGLWTQTAAQLDMSRANYSGLASGRESRDHHEAFFNLETMFRIGGFLRVSLRLLSALMQASTDTAAWANYSSMTLSIVAPPGLPALHPVYFQYLKICFENRIEFCQEANPERGNELEKFMSEISSKWNQHKDMFPSKRSALDGSSPAFKADEMMKDELKWKEGLTKISDALALEFEIAYRDAKEDLHEIARGTETWIREAVTACQESMELQIREERERRRKKFTTRKNLWSLVERSYRLQEVIQSADIASETIGDSFWRLDGYEDSQRRRWILRMDLEGTSHAEADISKMDESSSARDNVANGEDDMLMGNVNEGLEDLVKVPANALVHGAVLPVDYDSASDSEDGGQAHSDDVSLTIESGEIQTEPGQSPAGSERGRGSNSGSPLVSSSSLRHIDNVKSPIHRLQDEGCLSLAASNTEHGADSEVVLFKANCKRIRILGEVPVEMELTRRRLLFKSLELDSEMLAMSERDYSLSESVELYSMRHLLQPLAFELHFRSKESILVAMESKDARENFLKILEIQLKRNSRGTKIFRTLKSRQAAIRDATSRWRRRQISNFQYLMILNKLGGRTYNDAAQYPIFPWVIRDYQSQELDLSNPNSFRNLTKPMGCQASEEELGNVGVRTRTFTEVSKREAFFRERYESWDDPRGIPPFHYGSHYSSTGTIVHFLVRMEPFATLFLQHQGGHFDYPDRMFRSMEGAWKSSTTSTQNVSELVPEFFYNPEFIRNRNSLPLGVTQDGYEIGDIELPPWASQSPEMFVKIHREALESEYVSEHLNAWIDIIFGYKQRGKAAIDACNVFYYLTYEGSVDLSSLDESYRSALLEQIRHYGQTPLQLFKKQHVGRDALPESKAKVEMSSLCFNTEMVDSVAHINSVNDSIIIIGSSRVLEVLRLLHHPELTRENQYTLEGDGRIADAGLGTSKRGKGRRVGAAHFAPFTPGSSLEGCFAITSDGKSVISVGHWDGSIRCQSVADPGKPRQIVRQHGGVVSCVELSGDNQLMVTGARDSSVCIWELNRGSDPDKVLPDKPRRVLRGHSFPIVFVAMRKEIGVVVSGSDCGSCIIHSIRDGRIIRVLDPRVLITRALISSGADMIMISASERVLRNVTINGVLIAEVKTAGKPTAVCVTSDCRYVIDADDNGDVFVRATWNLEVIFQYERAIAPVTAMFLTKDDSKFLVGLKNGMLAVYHLNRETLDSRVKLAGIKGTPAPMYSF